MKKYFKIAWLIAFAVWAIATIGMSVMVYVNMYRSGFMITYMNWVRVLWVEMNSILPAYKYMMFGFIFFLVTMFFVFNNSSEEESC